LEARGASVHGVVADAAKREDADRLADVTKERFGRIDVLVNNAGITRDGLLLRMKDDDWDQVLNVILRGAFLMTRAVSKAMIRQIPLGRVGTAREVAEMVGFLAGDAAAYVTGQVFHVNGGLYL